MFSPHSLMPLEAFQLVSNNLIFTVKAKKKKETKTQIMVNINIKEERKKLVDFSTYYFYYLSPA